MRCSPDRLKITMLELAMRDGIVGTRKVRDMH